MSPSTVSKRLARAVESRQDGQSALILLALPVAVSYLPLQSADAGRLFSQLSSAVSSARDRFARFLWQPRMHAAALPRFFATEFSHFAKPLFDVMNPAVVSAERGLRDGQPDDQHDGQSTNQRQPLDHAPYLPGAGCAAGFCGPHS